MSKSKSNGFNATTALNEINPVSHWVEAFKPCTAKWPKGAGEAPTPAMLTAAAATFKSGRFGREALYMAMAFRPQGVRLVEFVEAGRPWGAEGRADNHIDKFADEPRRPGGPVGCGWVHRTLVTGARCLTLTPKGHKAIQGLTGALNGGDKATDTPKAKKAPKAPRKGKVAPAKQAPTPAPADTPLPNVPVEPVEPPQAA